MADTGIIEQYAAHLERKASAGIVRFTILFAVVGAVLGGFPLFSHSSGLVPHSFGMATLLLGAIAGAYLGYRSGERHAIEPRFQAQLALRQLQVEQSLMQGVSAQAAPAPVAPPATFVIVGLTPAICILCDGAKQRRGSFGSGPRMTPGGVG